MGKLKSTRKERSDRFPLTLHPTGQYCKRIRGRLYYFGSDKKRALEKYLSDAAQLHSGHAPEPGTHNSNLSLKNLCNLYLEHQHTRVQAGEIKPAQVSDQTTILRAFAQFLGPSRPVCEISTLELQRYRSKLIGEARSAARINNHISAFKAMLHWALNNQVIEKGPNLNAIKKLPRVMKHRETFTAEEIEKLVAHATANMRAMIWLGLNCGFGCTDCSELLWEHIDLDAARIRSGRTKTGILRNLPLWPETVNALRALPRRNARVFNTRYGNAYVRFKKSTDETGLVRFVKCDNVTAQFSRLMNKAGVNKGDGVGFYSLRRTAATLAARSGDPFAVQSLLGHADLRMATAYVQDISEQTDQVVNNSRKVVVRDSL